MSNIETVKYIYEAFGRGDVPAIVDKMDTNVEWDVEDPAPGVRWLQPRRGAVNVPGFFESLAVVSFERFEPHTLFENGNQVFALIVFEATHIASGKKYTFAHEGHLCLFNDAGKIVKYQHLADTAKYQRMAKGE